MRRLILAVVFAAAPSTPGLTDAKETAKAPRSGQALQPGTYRTSSFVTRFDDKGSWVTSMKSRDPTATRGRYTFRDGVVTFTGTPPYCPEERVRYRFIPSPNGFRLQFLDDNCNRGDRESYEFVRIAR